MNWKTHLIISGALITSLSVTLPVNATSLTEKRDEINEKADSVKKDIENRTAEAEELATQKQQAYQELQALSLQVADLEIQLYEQTSELIQIKDRISQLEVKEQEAKEQLEIRYEVLSERLVALQEYQSESSFFSILIESNSIGEFVNRALTVSYIISSDKDLMNTYEKEKAEYYNLKSEAEAELSEAEKVQAQLDKTKAELDQQQQKKSQYMTELNNRYGWKMDSIMSLQAEYAQLELQSDSLNQQIEEEKQQVTSNNNSSNNDNITENNNISTPSSGFDVRNMSNVTAADINNILTGQLSGYGSIFYEVGHSHGINPAFLAAITMAETGGDSSWLSNYNNVGGFIYKGRPMTFHSIEDSIRYMGSLLTRLYINDGLYTVEAIHSRYSPVGASNDPNNLNVNWVKNVYSYLSKAGVAV